VEGFHDLEAVKKMVYRDLGGETGLKVSILSLGASSLGSCFRETQLEESIAVVHYALKNGINLIDTSPWYGHGKSEEVLGKALADVPREAYYITTKCGRYEADVMEMFNFSAERVTKSVEESCKRMGVDYLDCIQIHDPEFAPSYETIIKETLPALAKLRAAGKVKMIGMTGYPLEMQKEIIQRFHATGGKIDTTLTYCHYSMNDFSLTKDLEFFKENKMGVINASAMSMGLLTHRGPPGWHPAKPEQKAACKAAAEYCESQGVNISTLANAFSLANEDIPTTLVSTASLERMKSNVAACFYKLTAKEQEVSDHVMKTFFNPLAGNETWVGVEVQDYWIKVGKATMSAKCYGGRYGANGSLSTN